MAENTLIEWATHTFNPYRGCTKISKGCKFCYADTLSKRNPGTLGIWGPNGTRIVASEAIWRQPHVWDKKAWQLGERHRVFCASLADVFEGQETMPAEAWPRIQQARQRLSSLIRQTPNLDWLLLTKRPENAGRMLVEMFGPDRSTWPTNFRVGTSVEDQATADERLPHLLALNWPNFVSAEPLLASVDLSQYLNKPCPGSRYGLMMDQTTGAYECCSRCDYTGISDELAIDWLIVGGESGPGARPMHPQWVRSIRDQCHAAGVPFLFKQWGEWAIWPGFDPSDKSPLVRAVFPDGSDLVDLTGRGANGVGSVRMARVGKKAAGRTLDGVIHDSYPEPPGVTP